MKPIVVFDIETTGLDKNKDYIIQFAAIKYNRETLEEIDSINYYIQPSGNYNMSIAALIKHRIKPSFLKDKPMFVEVAMNIYNFMEGCDLLTYNGLGFDAPFLKREFKDCGIEWNFSEYNFYDAFLEEKRRNGNTLSDTYIRYAGKTMEDAGYVAHDAFSDVKATFEIFTKQQQINEYNPEDILTEDNFIKNMEFNGKITECFTVGKWSGVSLEYVAKNDKSYMNWVKNNIDFDIKTRNICEKYI